jgi:hypothetical protein
MAGVPTQRPRSQNYPASSDNRSRFRNRPATVLRGLGGEHACAADVYLAQKATVAWPSAFIELWDGHRILC